MKFLSTFAFMLIIGLPSATTIVSISGCSTAGQRQTGRQNTRIESRTNKRIERRTGN